MHIGMLGGGLPVGESGAVGRGEARRGLPVEERGAAGREEGDLVRGMTYSILQLLASIFFF